LVNLQYILCIYKFGKEHDGAEMFICSEAEAG
jgi:hypothetical protein